MKNNYVALLLFSICILATVACDRPECQNTNPIFDQHPPHSETYKKELVRELALIDHKQLSYWLKDFDHSANGDRLLFYIQGAGLCAELQLSVNDWSRLQDLRSRKGQTYFGAEFTNLQFDIIEDKGQTAFVYRGFDQIID